MQVERYRCTERACRALNDYWMPHCPVCGTRGAMVPYNLVLPEERARIQPKPERPFKPVNASKPFEGRRIGTGFDSLDRVFGIGKVDKTQIGMHMPSVYLLAGEPGCGKTTLLMPMMAYLMQQGRHEALLASSEQSHEEIHTNVLGFGLGEELGDMNVCATSDDDHSGVDYQDINTVLDKLRGTKIEVVFLDSVNKFHDSVYDTKDTQMNKVIMMERIVADAFGCELVFGTRTDERTGKVIETRVRKPIPGATKRIYIVISHVNSDGDVSGRMEMLHDVAGIISLEMVPGFDDVRMVWCKSKNRWGKIKVPAFFTMGERGMEECDNPLEGIDPDSRVPIAVQLKRKAEKS